LVKYWQENTEDGLKVRAENLLAYGLCCRGDNIRRLHISEIGEDYYEEEGFHGSKILRTVWNKSKKNQFNKFQQNGCLRHLDPAECCIGAIAFCYFYKYHIRNEPW
jgi:hypothetical protein